MLPFVPLLSAPWHCWCSILQAGRERERGVKAEPVPSQGRFVSGADAGGCSPCCVFTQVRPWPCPVLLQVRAPRSCPGGSCCEPARLHLEQLLLLEGLREVEVVEGCHCSTCSEECLWLLALKTFFPDSPWEVMIDVGKCSDPTYSAGMNEGELLSLSLGTWEGALWCDQHQCPSSGHPVC